MRRILTFAISILWMVILFLPAFPLIVLGWPSHRWRLWVSTTYSRWWSRVTLWVAGIRVTITGREHLVSPSVLAFNHTSMLDFFLNALFAPTNCLVFGKRELARVPFLGWMWLCGGHPMIVRSERGQWQAVLDDVTAKLASGNYTTIVAPEGTRSGDGVLAPFKKGPFHTAVASKSPIVPVLLKNVADRFTHGRLQPGPIEVEILAPIPTADWDPEQLEAHIDAVREVFLQGLGQVDRVDPPDPGATPA